MSTDEILDIFAIANGEKYIEFKDLPEIWNSGELEFELSMGIKDIEDLSLEMVDCVPPCKFNEDREFLLTIYIDGVDDIYKHEDIFTVGNNYESLLKHIQQWVEDESGSRYPCHAYDVWSYSYDETHGEL